MSDHLDDSGMANDMYDPPLGATEILDELYGSAHIRSVAERVHPVLVMTCGTQNAPTLENTINDITSCVAALRMHPECQVATGHGIQVVRQPMGNSLGGDNYMVCAIAGTVYGTPLLFEREHP